MTDLTGHYVDAVLARYQSDLSVFRQYAAVYTEVFEEYLTDETVRMTDVNFITRCAEQDYRDGASGAAVSQGIYDELRAAHG